MLHQSKTYYIRAWGESAIWLGPSFRVERFSNLVPSHGGAVGLLRAVLGKWEMSWQVSSVTLLKKPRHMVLTTNELKFTNASGPYDISTDRTQRTTTILRDVDYLITANIVMNPHFAGPEDNIKKFETMFEFRMERGQERKTPYFGQREHAASLELVSDPSSLTPIDITEDMGIAFYDVDWEDPQKPHYFAPLRIEKGVARYPSWEEVRALGISRLRGVA